MDSTDAAVEASKPKTEHPENLCPCHGCRVAYARGVEDGRKMNA